MNLANLHWWGWIIFALSVSTLLDDLADLYAFAHGRVKEYPRFLIEVVGLMIVLYIVGTP